MSLINFRSYFKFLAKNKLYTVVNILGFAISLMFVFLLGVYVIQEFSVDKFHDKKDRIYMMANSPENASFGNAVGGYLQEKFPEIESYVRVVSRDVIVRYNNEEDTFYEALFADSTFFNVFSFNLIEGNPSQVLATQNSVVVTRSFANKIFHNENPIGKTFMAIGSEVTITGIVEDLPNNTQFPDVDFILNYNMIKKYWGEDILDDWGNSSFTIYFLEKEGSNLPSKADQIVELFKNDYWTYRSGLYNEVIFIPLEDVYFSPHQAFNIDLKRNSKSLVYIYFAITILILLVAVLNYINLSVSQVSSRGKEAALKKLLGSSKKKIILQFISESVLMAFFASLLGVILAFAAEPFFNNTLNTSLKLLQYLNLSGILIILTGTIMIGIISGLFPAIVVSGFKPIEVIKGSYSLKVNAVYSKILITFQYIVAISLLICSIFLIRQTNYMKNYNLGFDKDKIFIMSNISNPERLKSLKDELFRIPGVENISYSAGTPLDGGNNFTFEYNDEPVSFQMFYVDSAFFDVYGVKLYPFDTLLSNSIWLNSKGFNILQPDSITHRVFIQNEEGDLISGTVSDFNFRSLHQPIGPAMVIYMNEFLSPWSISVKISQAANAFETADAIKEVYSNLNDGAIFDSKFADDVIQMNYENENKTSKIIIAFSVLTIVILMMGILAMSLYYVKRKEKEIAIRKVNGAEEKSIIYMLNINFIRWIIIAFIIAVPLSYFIMQKWLQSFAFKISLSWWVFILAGLLIITLSVIFVTLQSWKTATANPIDSLKNE